MSVSARAHLESAEEPQSQPITPRSGESSSADHGQDPFLTPRVLDERAFREFTGQLRAMLNDAESVAGQLAEAAEQHQSDCAEATQRSRQLQDRLRLSARMLKAIQVQSESLEQSTQRAEQLEQRLNQLNDEYEQRIATLDERLAELDQRRAELDRHQRQAAEQAEQRFESHAEQVMERVRRTTEHAEGILHEIDERVSETLPHAERLCHMVETAEVNIAALSHRSADNTSKAQHVSEQLEDRARQCAETLADADRRFDRLEQLSGILSRAELLHQRWLSAVEHMERSVTSAGPDGGDAPQQPATGEDVGEAEPASAPAQLVDGTTEVKASNVSVDAIVAELRNSIGQDMARLSQVVYDIATRVDRLQAQRAGQEAEPSGHARPDVQTVQQHDQTHAP